MDSQQNKPVYATTFAYLKDIEAFKAAKARGLSDAEAFKFGDNGIGFTGMLCATEKQNICALPREEWMNRHGSKAAAAGKKVAVAYNGRIAIAILGDTMPAYANIKNGAGIDLNPGLANALGIKQGSSARGVVWCWVD